MKRIGIIAKTQHPYSGKALLKLNKWLNNRNIEAIMDRETAEMVSEKTTIQKADIPGQVDMIIVLGGDGTLISAARLVEENKIPILGVNLGSLGFLTEIPLEELYPTLEKVLNDDYKTEDRMMIDADIIREGKEVGSYTALNDVVINRGALARIVELEIHVDGVYVTTYRSDGLIVSTPTGSTAYSLACAGPIIYPTLKALVLTPICPHTLTNRPIVIPDNVEIQVNLVTRDEDVLATIDGQIGFSLSYRDSIKIKKSANTTRLIQSSHKNYYQILREKLKWGEQLGIKNANKIKNGPV